MQRSLSTLLFLALLAMPSAAQSVVQSWSTAGPFPGGLEYEPSGGGTIWVVDSNVDQIQKYDRVGNLLAFWPAPIPPGFSTAIPIGCGLDPNTGMLWIGDENEYLYEFDPSTGLPTGVGFSTLPDVTDVSGVAVDPATGNIFISQDSTPRHITEFDQLGNVVASITLPSSSIDPDGLAYNPTTGTFLTGEDIGDRILEVDRAGSLLGFWDMGALGISPEGLGIDLANGTVWIADGFGATVWEVAGILGGGGLQLAVSGTCPGPMTFSVTGANSNTIAYVYGVPGSFTWNGSPCTGTTVDIANPQFLLGGTSLAANVPAGACGVIRAPSPIHI